MAAHSDYLVSCMCSRYTMQASGCVEEFHPLGAVADDRSKCCSRTNEITKTERGSVCEHKVGETDIQR